MKTKINLILIGLIFFTGFYVKAQYLKYGLVAGFDVANAHMTNKPEIEGNTRVFHSMMSFNINGYIGFKSDQFWGLSIEPGFIQKGGAQRYSEEDSLEDVRIQCNYVQIPLLADLYINNKLFISIGPELAYMINAKAKSKSFSNDISFLYDNKFEISGLIGICYNINNNISLALRYNHGFTYISKIIFTNEFGDTTGESKEYNQYFQLLVRYKIKSG